MNTLLSAIFNIVRLSVILLKLKLTKVKPEVLKSDFQRKREIKAQINLHITGKISLKFDFSSSLFL